MKTYARTANGVVVELLNTIGDINAMFHHDLRWVEITDVIGVAYGWTYDGSRFMAPVPAVTQLPAK